MALFELLFIASDLFNNKALYSLILDSLLLHFKEFEPLFSHLILSKSISWLPQQISSLLLLHSSSPLPLLRNLKPNCLVIDDLIKKLNDVVSICYIHYTILHDLITAFNVLLESKCNLLHSFITGLYENSPFLPFSSIYLKAPTISDITLTEIYTHFDKLDELGVLSIKTHNPVYLQQLELFLNNFDLGPTRLYLYYTHLLYLLPECTDTITAFFLTCKAQIDGLHDINLLYLYLHCQIEVDLPNRCLFYKYMHTDQYTLAVNHLPDVISCDFSLNQLARDFYCSTLFAMLSKLLNMGYNTIYTIFPELYAFDEGKSIELLRLQNPNDFVFNWGFKELNLDLFQCFEEPSHLVLELHSNWLFKNDLNQFLHFIQKFKIYCPIQLESSTALHMLINIEIYTIENNYNQLFSDLTKFLSNNQNQIIFELANKLAMQHPDKEFQLFIVYHGLEHYNDDPALFLWQSQSQFKFWPFIFKSGLQSKYATLFYNLTTTIPFTIQTE